LDVEVPLTTISRLRRRRFWGLRRREQALALLASLPALGLYLLFTCYPLVMSLGYAFTNWNGYSKQFDLVGMANLVTVFQDDDIRQAFGNTLLFASFSVGLGLIIQTTLAIVLSGRFPGRNLARTLLYLPALFSSVVVALTWISLLQYTGVLNELLRFIGLDSLVVDWLADVNAVKPALIAINLWQYTGYGMVVLMAGIASIPRDVLEAASLDGAVGWQQVRFITLPLIMPALTVSLFLGITGALKVFELPLLLTNGGPRGASTTVVMEIYTNAFGYERFGVASALGIVFFLFIATITVVQLVVTRSREVQY
jgi:raffinose/stachyose/melibiose transport system permease protein